jgi:hypothetical protein
MYNKIAIAILMIIVLLVACAEKKLLLYEKNSTVGIKIINTWVPKSQINILESDIYELLDLFAKERKDFQVSRDSNDVSHIIEIKIDSVWLVIEYSYKKKHKKVDSLVTRKEQQVANTAPLLDAGRGMGGALAAASYGVSLRNRILTMQSRDMMKKNLMRPYMIATIILKNVKTNAITMQSSERIEAESYVPVSEGEQLKQLLHILKQTVRDRVPYFKV